HIHTIDYPLQIGIICASKPPAESLSGDTAHVSAVSQWAFDRRDGSAGSYPWPRFRRFLMSWQLFEVTRKSVHSSHPRPRRRLCLQVEALEDRTVPSTAYLAADLVSDQPGVAPITDPNLVNAWGIAFNPS